MPFDIGVMPNDQRFHLQHAYDLIKQGWTQFRCTRQLSDGNIGYCAIGAIDDVSRTYCLNYEQRKDLIMAVCDHLPLKWRIVKYLGRSFTTPEQILMAYNDHPSRRQHQLLRLFADTMENK